MLNSGLTKWTGNNHLETSKIEEPRKSRVEEINLEKGDFLQNANFDPTLVISRSENVFSENINLNINFFDKS